MDPIDVTLFQLESLFSGVYADHSIFVADDDDDFGDKEPADDDDDSDDDGEDE